MAHMKDQFAHDEHDRQPCGVENGLPGSPCRRHGIQHHNAYAAEKIRQSHDQRVDGKQPRQGERCQQTQRRDQQADFHCLRVYCALCPECTEQQTQNFKCRGQQRNQGHPCVARAAEGAPPVLGDCRDMLLFPLLPPLLRRIFFRKGFVFPRRSALRRLVRRIFFFFSRLFYGGLWRAFGFHCIRANGFLCAPHGLIDRILRAVARSLRFFLRCPRHAFTSASFSCSLPYRFSAWQDAFFPDESRRVRVRLSRRPCPALLCCGGRG